MRKIKVWKWENWPDRGQQILRNPILGILTTTLLILLLAGLSSCTQIPVTGYSPTGEIMSGGGDPSLFQSDTNSDPLFAEEIQLSKTALFETTPQPDNCHMALAGNPLDASIPDGTLLNAGEAFVKIWRVRNAGECAWTREYSIVWFSGENMGTDEVVRFSENVLPGETIELSVDMIAPVEAGGYQSNWKICDQNDTCFGLGSKGEYPFWAKIEVREFGTITPSPQISSTPTSVVFASGRVQLINGDEFDLDNGQEAGDEIADIGFGEAESGFVLAAINGAEIAWFGQSVPTQSQCNSLLYVSDSISLQDMDTSEVICYKSSSGLPGYIQFNLIDILNGKINIEYTTWQNP